MQDSSPKRIEMEWWMIYKHCKWSKTNTGHSSKEPHVRVTTKWLLDSCTFYALWYGKTSYDSSICSSSQLIKWVTYQYCLLPMAYPHLVLKSFGLWHTFIDVLCTFPMARAQSHKTNDHQEVSYLIPSSQSILSVQQDQNNQKPPQQLPSTTQQ